MISKKYKFPDSPKHPENSKRFPDIQNRNKERSLISLKPEKTKLIIDLREMKPEEEIFSFC